MPHIDSTKFGEITIDGKKYGQVLIVGGAVFERNEEKLRELFGTEEFYSKVQHFHFWLNAS